MLGIANIWVSTSSWLDNRRCALFKLLLYRQSPGFGIVTALRVFFYPQKAAQCAITGIPRSQDDRSHRLRHWSTSLLP